MLNNMKETRELTAKSGVYQVKYDDYGTAYRQGVKNRVLEKEHQNDKSHWFLESYLTWDTHFKR